tara:strand:- start:157 stop:711 length:555 start_codon:yes stop_codon:yes gene_type:complete
MSTKIEELYITSTRSTLKCGRVSQAGLKQVADWWGKSVVGILGMMKQNGMVVDVAVRSSDDKMVCAMASTLPGLSKYKDKVTLTDSEKEEVRALLTESQVVWVYTAPDERNKGYYGEFSDAMMKYVMETYSHYEKTKAELIDPNEAGATYVKQHIAGRNYSTPTREGNYDRAELTRAQWETDNP